MVFKSKTIQIDQNFVRQDFLGQAIRHAALSRAPRIEVELMC